MLTGDPWGALRDDMAQELAQWDRAAMSPVRMANELLDLVEHHGFDACSRTVTVPELVAKFEKPL